MPVRSLTSSVLKWPDAATVALALRQWAYQALRGRHDVVRLGCFGSYARGDWGVGSDLDLIVVLSRSDLPFERRGCEWDTSGLPVPADVVVYTQAEWDATGQEGRRFHRTVMAEAEWLFGGDCP